MKLEVRKVWSKEWMNVATKDEIKKGVVGVLGTVFCLGMLAGLLVA